MNLEKSMSSIHYDTFTNIINMDKHMLYKKHNHKNVQNDINSIISYKDLELFLQKYKSDLSSLGFIQLELIMKDIKWDTSIHVILAASKFKKLLKK